MELNHNAIFGRIRSLAATNRPVGQGMREVIDLCAGDVPHPDWPQLAAIDYDGDVERLRPWIPAVFAKEPPPFPAAGLFVNLCNPGTQEGQIWADMGLMTTADYDPGDTQCGWLWSSQRFYPQDALANSAALRSIYGIAFGSFELAHRPKDKLRNNAEWPLNLAYGALAVSRLLAGQTTRVLGSTVPRIGVVVGFGEGDMIKIGELTPTGFDVAG
jgi:hypothetical protein